MLEGTGGRGVAGGVAGREAATAAGNGTEEWGKSGEREQGWIAVLRAPKCDSITACEASARGPLPVTRGSADPGNRSVRIQYNPDKRQTRLGRICPSSAYFESFRWRSTCDHPVAHQPQPRSREFSGTSKSQGRLAVKGLILCKPDLDH